jgi:RNA polymerase sigma-70 factor (ECF subfamily)
MTGGRLDLDDRPEGNEHGHRVLALATPKADGQAVQPAWSERVRLAYDEIRRPLWRALVAWAGSVDVADEAMSEAFAQLLRRGNDVRDPAAWAWRTAFRIAAGDLQRRRSGPVAIGLATSPTDSGREVADPTRGLPDDAIDLVRALAHLSPQQRRCIALVDVAGHTAPSAAAVLGTTAATVRVQLMRARRHLRTLLAEPPTTEETP